MAEHNVVAARLSIETDGEPEAFSEAASAVDALQGSASSAEPSLTALTGQLAALGAQAKGMGPAGEAFERFTQAVQKMGEADGVEAQKAAVEGALKAWKEFGDQVPDILAKGGKAAKEYQETLERLEERHRRLAEPLSGAAEEAEGAMKSLADSTKSGFQGVEEKVVRVRQALNEYRRAVDEAGEAGESATEEEIAKLQQLEGEYDQALEAVGRYRAAKREAARDMDAAAAATGNEVKSINDLGDVATAASPKLAKMVTTATLMVGALTAGYAAGEKLRGILNKLTNGEFDQFIQKSAGMAAAANVVERALNLLAGGADDATRRLEELSNQRRIFENLGLEGFSADVEKNAEILSRHGKQLHDWNALWEEFAKRIGLSRAELGRQADEIVRAIEAFGKANPQIDPKIFQGIIKEQIQPLLDAYARLGIQAPQALRALAAEWSVTTSRVESDAKKHAAAVREMVDQITGITSNTLGELRQVAEVVSDAIASINTVKLDPEGLARARLEVQTMVDAFRVAKAEIPPSLIAAADKVGVFVVAMERAGGVIPVFTGAVDAAADSTRRLQVRTDAGRKSVEDFAESNVRMAQDVNTGRAAIETVNPVAGQTQISLEALKQKYGETGRSARAAGEDVAAGTAQLAEGAKKLDGATKEVDATGDSLGYAGDQAAAAAPSLAAAGEGAQDLGAKSAQAKEGVGGLAGEVTLLEERLDTLKTTAVTMAASVADAIGNLRGFTQPLLAEIEVLIAGVQRARAEIQELGAGADAAAPPPQSSH